MKRIRSSRTGLAERFWTWLFFLARDHLPAETAHLLASDYARSRLRDLTLSLDDPILGWLLDGHSVAREDQRIRGTYSRFRYNYLTSD